MCCSFIAIEGMNWKECSEESEDGSVTSNIANHRHACLIFRRHINLEVLPQNGMMIDIFKLYQSITKFKSSIDNK